MLLNRELAAAQGRETKRILEAGSYVSESGHRIEIASMLKQAVEGTRSYPADEPAEAPPPKHKSTTIAIANETSLASAERLIQAGYRPAVLNFASAKHPGGGFLSGARAQEESLARSSGLYTCLVGNEMYAYHHKQRNPLYSDYAIYSPDVPVFRTDDGAFRDEPLLCSFITCAAVNANEILQNAPFYYSEIEEAMWKRILKILTIGAKHGHDAIVLGAWGCGAFGNDANQIAGLFSKALRSNFQGVYLMVVFAILDFSDEEKFIGPFRKAFEEAR
ncbi:MAG: TIGR02452 family protein [Chloroflexi bacterium]|nr:TIGR02452 family protein [Chloroflexota bacterium]